MANTTTCDGHFLSIQLDGATDWNITADLPQYLQNGIKVKSITVATTSAADAVIIRNSRISEQTAPKILEFLATAEVLHWRQEYGEGTWMYPAFDAAECTEATTVMIELA